MAEKENMMIYDDDNVDVDDGSDSGWLGGRD